MALTGASTHPVGGLRMVVMDLTWRASCADIYEGLRGLASRVRSLSGHPIEEGNLEVKVPDDVANALADWLGPARWRMSGAALVDEIDAVAHEIMAGTIGVPQAVGSRDDARANVGRIM